MKKKRGSIQWVCVCVYQTVCSPPLPLLDIKTAMEELGKEKKMLDN